MLKKEEKNVYVAKNGDAGKKRKPYQSNPAIWIYHFLNLERQDAGSYYFVAFLNYPRLSIEREPIFFVQKNIPFSNIKNCMLKRDMEFRLLYLVVRQFFCNTKIPLRNSVITPFKVSNISVAGCWIFW